MGGLVAFGVLVVSFALAVMMPPEVQPLPLVRRAAATSVARVRPVSRQHCGTAGTQPCPALPRPRHAGAAVADPIVAAFAVQWDPASRASLARIGDRLDWVIVEGAFLGRGAPGEITMVLDKDLLAAAVRQQVAVHLMLTNFAAGNFDPKLVEAITRTPERRAHAIAQLVQTMTAHGLQGITVDFERVRPQEHRDVVLFLTELRAAVAPLRGTVSVAVPVGADETYPLAQYGRAADFVIAMLYDEHAVSSLPGAVASADWYAEHLDEVLDAVPASQVVVALGQYGYHWRADQRDAMSTTVSEAMALAQSAPDTVQWDPATRTPHATWHDAAGVSHELWFLDAVTTWNQWRVSRTAGVAGLALWRLGSEDATIWRVLGRTGLHGNPSELASLPDNGLSLIAGDGEVLGVTGARGTGLRAVTVSRDTTIEREQVVRAPGGYVVTRGGAARKRVALTFDDGPDAQFTGPILDTLRSRRAVGSFFVVGRQVQRLPGLARRIANEGHEIGNHTFSHPDLAGLSESAVRIELATAGRVIEAVTGRRPMLFRPPYIGDARPATEERLRPMAVATALGYSTAGLEIDTRDWEQKDPRAIVRLALEELESSDGHIVLLHDAGGDRTPTIAALGPLIDSLRARGYEITTVAGLLDVAPDAGLPVSPPNEALQRRLNLAAITIARVFEWLLVFTFRTALVLGLIRLIGICVLAAVQRTSRRYARRATDGTCTPTVSVIVPAYNEGQVITRTITSLLSQDYPALEVVLVDDGSTDDTLVAARTLEGDPRLRVITQTNGGKSSALNHGIRDATGEIIVVVDADTLLAADAIRHLVQPLADRRVGAVAGNAKVGNRVNLVTRFQAVEYITSQNLDRRAFVLLNCITVVPGAIGAWRRDAVLAAGGFRTDTMAEDQDLTLTLLRHGHRVALADRAIAWTEAPETLDALLRQRFRWSFGTLQCAWKHRAAMHERGAGALGLVALPNIWLFQLLFPLLSPAADLTLAASLIRLAVQAPAIGLHAAWAQAEPVVALYALFLVIDTLTGLVGLAFERGESVWQVVFVPLQRVAYRQVLYVALLRAMRAALKGRAPGWNKLERTGRVSEQDEPAPPPRAADEAQRTAA